MKTDALTVIERLPLDPRGFRVGAASTAVSFPEDGHLRVASIEGGRWFQHRNRCILATCGRFDVPGPFLDVGGGNGAVSAALLERYGRDLALVEPGPDGVITAVRRGLPHVVLGSLESVGLPDATVGGIGAFDVLEHLENDQTLLRESRRVLRPTGRMVVTVPAYEMLWSAEDDFAGHFRRYAPATLRRSFERAGFTVEFVGAFHAATAVGVALLRTAPFLLGRSTAVGDADRYDGESRLLDLVPGPIWEREVNRLRRGRPGRLGSSLIAVARPG